MPQQRRDVVDERGALEPPEGADGDADGFGIPAVRAGADRRHIVSGQRTPILALDHRQPRTLRRGRGRQRHRHRRGKNGPRVHVRAARVAAAYSSICAVRSRGYEIWTSTIALSAPTSGVSFGITNPVYDGRFRRSTRATISSLSAGSK